jgi:Xaa-Pro aminopeptidase
MADQHVDAVLLSVGADLPWLTGYEAMPLERLTMLVIPRDERATLLVPRLEAPRVVEQPALFDLAVWEEGDDPLELVTKLAGPATTVAIGNRTWSQFLVELLARMPGSEFCNASQLLGPLRAVKDPEEVAALRRAAEAVDRIARDLQTGEIPLVGRSEAEVSADLGRRILAEGHHRVNFAIVAAGENAASPHHEAGDRRIRPGEVVLCDFGGTMLTETGAGYCSDITRCIYTGEPPEEFRHLYAVLHEAQHAAVSAAAVGAPCEDVDSVARELIADAGYGDQFVHRTGHGIGVEEHEDPYIVQGNRAPLAAGNVFSVEPGIYVPGSWGARLEDIVVATDEGPDPLNVVDHALAVVES